MTQYPITANAEIVDEKTATTFLEWLFEYVDWTSGGTVSLMAVGEKGTAQEGHLRGDRHFLSMENASPLLEAEIGRNLKRWAQYHGGAFFVPAIVASVAKLTKDVTEDKIVGFTNICADLDSGDTDEGVAWLTRYLGEPSRVVQSGGTTATGHPKRHVYYRFTEPTSQVLRVGIARKALAAKIGGDRSFGRITQVIRVPGSVYCKGGAAKPVTVEREAALDYELDELLEAIEQMPSLTGEVVGKDMVSNPFDFSDGAGKSTSPVMDALQNKIYEGGATDENRWSNFSRVAGFNVQQARLGFQTVEEAANNTYGWMHSNMVPPWPDERFSTEFRAILNRDAVNNGPIVPLANPTAGTSPEKSEALDNVDQLRSWAVHRRAIGTPPPRRMLVDGLVFSGKRHMLVAEGGAGKTFLCMELALKLAASDPSGPTLQWIGQDIRPEAHGGTVIIMTGEDDADELAIRWHSMDPDGSLRRKAGDRLIALPLDNLGGAFPLVSYHPSTREPIPSIRWKQLYQAIRGIKDQGGFVSAIIIDTLNSTLHGEENSAVIIGEYIRAVAPICGELNAALVITHHVRKKDKEPITTLEDMREAIRGSTALPNAMRLVIGFWPVADYMRRMKAMGMTPARNMLFRGGVLKANMPEAMQESRLLLKQKNGLLQDVTHRDLAGSSVNYVNEKWLVWAIKRAADMGAPFAKSGQNSVYSRRASLPASFHNLSRELEIGAMIDRLLSSGEIIQRALNNAGRSHNFLDHKECENVQRVMKPGIALNLEHERFFYDGGYDEIRELGPYF